MADSSPSSIPADAFAFLTTLEAGWDSYGGQPIDARAIESAQFIVRMLRDAPAIVPRSCGGVQLEWQRCGIHVEIAIPARGGAEFLVDPENDELTERELFELRASLEREREARAQLESALSDVVMACAQEAWINGDFERGGADPLIDLAGNVLARLRPDLIDAFNRDPQNVLGALMPAPDLSDEVIAKLEVGRLQSREERMGFIDCDCIGPCNCDGAASPSTPSVGEITTRDVETWMANNGVYGISIGYPSVTLINYDGDEGLTFEADTFENAVALAQRFMREVPCVDDVGIDEWHVGATAWFRANDPRNAFLDDASPTTNSVSGSSSIGSSPREPVGVSSEPTTDLDAKVLASFNACCLAVHPAYHCCCMLPKGHAGDHAPVRDFETSFTWPASSSGTSSGSSEE